MLNLGGVRDRPELTRRLGITVALLVAYRLGVNIPLPGMNPEALAQLGGTAVERISILALGITPFITILILAELLKVLAPRVRAWEEADSRNHDKLNRIVVGLSLLAAAAQASGLALALEDVRHLVEEPGTTFRLTCVATLVAGTAIVIWLADQITRHGLGSGVWLLLLTPWLAAVIQRYAALAAWGSVSLVVLEIVVGCALAAIVLAFTVKLLKGGGAAPQTATTSLWSVLLADALWPWVILLLALLLGGGIGGVGPWLSPGHPIALLALAGLVALFAYLYVRSQRIAGSTPLSPIPTKVLACGLAAITFADMGLATQLPGILPMAGHLVLVAVVALSILAHWWQPPFETAAQDAAHTDK